MNAENCIIRMNDSPLSDLYPYGISTLRYCDIDFTYACPAGIPDCHNSNADPLFANPGALNFRLTCSSPCIDAGSIGFIAADVTDLNGNGNFTEAVPYDRDGGPGSLRVVNLLDLGAYEAAAPELCLADSNHDNVVNVADLLAVINSWGPCPSPCPTDFSPNNGVCPQPDGLVNTGDLLAVINSWGPCPYSSGQGGVAGGFPHTISECFNTFCAGLEGAEWQNCINKCIEGVCSEHPEQCQ